MQETLEKLIGTRLLERGWQLGVAESCTGGLLAHRITNIPGSSAYFAGGFIVYSNEAKMHLLGVHAATLDTFGAVSPETVKEMAAGVRQRLGVQVAVSISGIAGPGGGTPDKPVGLTWVGLSMPGKELQKSAVWSGDRLQNKEQSVHLALEILWEALNGTN